jgi:hypothetical protein
MIKEHLEFFTLDLSSGWETPGLACCVFSRVRLPPNHLSTTIGKKYFWFQEP